MDNLLGKKIGMTQIFDEAGNIVPVTVVEAGPCFVAQVKTTSTDGYNAVQLGFGVAKKINKPKKGHLKGASLKYLKEFRVEKIDGFKVGQEIKVDTFNPGDQLTVSGITIGKGFAGTVKRHKFSRGLMSHGSKSHRLPGSIGAGTTPARVWPGTKMSGRMGGDKITLKAVKVVSVDAEKNILLLKGALPGKKGSLIIITRTSKTSAAVSKEPVTEQAAS